MDQAISFEQTYVHQVYDSIAPHFSRTRFDIWPVVGSFLNSLAPGSLVYDIGCGNGKYLSCNPQLCMVGLERSERLSLICASRRGECVLADNLATPFKECSADAVISIAVIHHFSTPARRLQAMRECCRVVRPNGLVLIYVWSLEYGGTARTVSLSGKHTLVPWTLPHRLSSKPSGQTSVLQRYYYLFVEGELQELALQINAVVEESGLEKGNWWVRLRVGK